MNCKFYLLIIVLLFCASTISAAQINVAKVEQMLNEPSPYIMRDWKQVAIDYDNFVFDFSKTGQYLPLPKRTYQLGHRQFYLPPMRRTHQSRQSVDAGHSS